MCAALVLFRVLAVRLPVETKVADEVVDLIDMEVVYLQFLLEEKRVKLVVSLFIVDLSLNCALGRDGEELENKEEKNNDNVSTGRLALRAS